MAGARHTPRPPADFPYAVRRPDESSHGGSNSLDGQVINMTNTEPA